MRLSFAVCFILYGSWTFALASNSFSYHLQQRDLELLPRDKPLREPDFRGTKTVEDIDRRVRQWRMEHHPDRLRRKEGEEDEAWDKRKADQDRQFKGMPMDELVQRARDKLRLYGDGGGPSFGNSHSDGGSPSRQTGTTSWQAVYDSELRAPKQATAGEPYSYEEFPSEDHENPNYTNGPGAPLRPNKHHRASTYNLDTEEPSNEEYRRPPRSTRHRRSGTNRKPLRPASQHVPVPPKRSSTVPLRPNPPKGSSSNRDRQIKIPGWMAFVIGL